MAQAAPGQSLTGDDARRRPETFREWRRRSPTMIVTGERVVTTAGGFNPNFQHHVAAYALLGPYLPPGRILDLGCGVGHSFELLAPRETVGVDIDAASLEGQDRETVVADMRDLPFPDASFQGLISVQSIEHVPDPEAVVAEARRVVEPGGVAIFVTVNRLTFARPDEIIDPYHEQEFDAEQLGAVCRVAFDDVELLGSFGSPAYLQLIAEQHAKLDRLLALDPWRIRRRVPLRARRRLYDVMLTLARRKDDPRASAITPGDFELRSYGLESAVDVVAVCR